MITAYERRSLSRLVLAALLTAGIAGSALSQSTNSRTSRDDTTQEDDRARRKREEREEKERAKRFEKLSRDDRAALDEVMGFEAPEFTATVDWIGDSGAPSVQSLRGKVVVIQTFSTKSGSTRILPDRVSKSLAEFGPEDVQVIAIHTPDGEDKAEALIASLVEKSKLKMPIGVDRVGTYCDLIGAYKTPVNVVIDRTGDIRAGGLTMDGLAATVKEFVDEPFDPANKPTKKPHESSQARKDFPIYKSAVRGAADLRGKQSPPLPNVNWWNGKPQIERRLVVVDFWATWCAPCREAIPHMNTIAKAYPADVACVGISDESSSDFDRDSKKHSLRKSSFQYAVGVDPAGSMKRAFGISAIPHAVVISSDGVVRWQGSPFELSAEVMRELVEANRSLLAVRGDTVVGNRWKRDAEDEANRKTRRSKRD